MQMRMRRALCLAPGLLAGNAHADDIHCNIESGYDLDINPQSVILARDSGVPKWIAMRGDGLFVDDRRVALETTRTAAAAGQGAGKARAAALHVAAAAGSAGQCAGVSTAARRRARVAADQAGPGCGGRQTGRRRGCPEDKCAANRH